MIFVTVCCSGSLAHANLHLLHYKVCWAHGTAIGESPKPLGKLHRNVWEGKLSSTASDMRPHAGWMPLHVGQLLEKKAKRSTAVQNTVAHEQRHDNNNNATSR